jgi:F0F1-type ATP synthase membrane subunit b/b'
MASAKPQRRREIESDLWDAEARHQKALKRMAEVSKELSRAQQMTMGDIT